MSLKLTQHAAIGSEDTLSSEKHILFVLNEKAEKVFRLTEFWKINLNAAKLNIKI
jgi:hypothetical protein